MSFITRKTRQTVTSILTNEINTCRIIFTFVIHTIIFINLTPVANKSGRADATAIKSNFKNLIKNLVLQSKKYDKK